LAGRLKEIFLLDPDALRLLGDRAKARMATKTWTAQGSKIVSYLKETVASRFRENATAY
jgi:hypothetical protein